MMRIRSQWVDFEKFIKKETPLKNLKAGTSGFDPETESKVSVRQGKTPINVLLQLCRFRNNTLFQA